MTKNNSKIYSRYLLLLLFLFCFRVAAQVIQVIYPVGFLPPFDTWQSGALPYPILLLIQIVMIIFMGKLVWHFHKGSVTPKKKRGKKLIIFGVIYFIAMIFRMIAGQTFGSNHYWLNAPLPTLFHYVLASYVLCWGHYHYKYGNGGQHAPLNELEKRGARVEYLNFMIEDSPEGTFIDTMLAAQSQLEREQIGRQTKQKTRARLEKGYWTFRAPIGYKYISSKQGGKELVKDEPLASIVKEALEGFASGRFATQTEM